MDGDEMTRIIWAWIKEKVRVSPFFFFSAARRGVLVPKKRVART
jgi:hypothetical protein